MSLFQSLGDVIFGGQGRRTAARHSRNATQQATLNTNAAVTGANRALDPFNRIGVGAASQLAALSGVSPGQSSLSAAEQVDYQALGQRPDLQAEWQRLQGSDKGRDLFQSFDQYLQWFVQNYGTESTPVPELADPLGGGAGGGVPTQDQAYEDFLNSGRYRSQVALNEANRKDIVGSFGAAGNALSGASLLAVGDELKRGEAGAFDAYTGDLFNLSGQGAATASQSGANALNGAFANNQAVLGNAGVQGQVAQGNSNAFANVFGDIFDGAAAFAGQASIPGFGSTGQVGKEIANKNKNFKNAYMGYN